MSGGNVGGLSQAQSETENDRRTEGSPAGDLGQAGQPTSGTNRQSCQRVLNACVAAEGGHFEHSQ